MEIYDDEFSAFAEIIADKTIERIRQHEAEVEAENDPAKLAKKMLAEYRRLKRSLKEDIEISKEDALGLHWKYLEELMGKPDNQIVSENIAYIQEKSLQYKKYKIRKIERAVALYKMECEDIGTEEAMRRYRIICMAYMDNVACSVRKIAEIECLSEKTVYKDIGIACKVVAVYLSAF